MIVGELVVNPGKKLFGEVMTEAVDVCFIIDSENGFWSTGIQIQSSNTFLDTLRRARRYGAPR